MTTDSPFSLLSVSKPSFSVAFQETVSVSPNVGFSKIYPGQIGFTYQNDASGFIDPNLFLKICFKIVKEDGTHFPAGAANDKVTLATGILSAFSAMSFRINGVLVEATNNLGLLSWLKNVLTLTRSELEHQRDTAFFTLDDTANGTVNQDNTTLEPWSKRHARTQASDVVYCYVKVPLSILSANKMLPPGVRLDLVLNHHSDNWRLHAAPDNRGKLVITEASLIFKKIYFTKEISQKFLQDFSKQPIQYTFKRAHLLQNLAIPIGSTIFTQKLYYGQQPLAAIAFLQEPPNSTAPSIHGNPYKFRHENISHCYFIFEGVATYSYSNYVTSFVEPNADVNTAHFELLRMSNFFSAGFNTHPIIPHALSRNKWHYAFPLIPVENTDLHNPTSSSDYHISTKRGNIEVVVKFSQPTKRNLNLGFLLLTYNKFYLYSTGIVELADYVADSP